MDRDSPRPAENGGALPEETGPRLAEVKGRWDPDGVIRANHALSLASA